MRELLVFFGGVVLFLAIVVGVAMMSSKTKASTPDYHAVETNTLVNR
jgi:hypothetical protein